MEAICDRVIIINKGNLVADEKLSELQQQMLSNSIKVTFQENIEKHLFSAIDQIKTLNKIDGFSWQITANDTGLVKKQILEMSLQHNLNIVSLQTEGGGLEDIFRTVTAS